MNDTTKARKFIKENIDKMERKEIVRKLYKITNLSKTTIQGLMFEREHIRDVGIEKLEGKDGRKAKEFIEKNIIDKMTEEEIIDYLVKNTRLNELSAEAIYLYVRNGEDTKKNKFIESEEIKYKGRKRSFFRIDDSKLWRSV